MLSFCRGETFDDLDQAQRAFDARRQRYNHHRPHDAFELAVLVDRYRPSVRSFNPLVLPFDYGPDDIVRSRGPASAFLTALQSFQGARRQRTSVVAHLLSERRDPRIFHGCDSLEIVQILSSGR